MENKKLPVPTEHEECLILVEYLVRKGIKFTHINNEIWTSSWNQKRRAKESHVDSGVPDYLIVVEAEQCKEKKSILLFIEMKRSNLKESAVKPNQKEWIRALNRVDNVEATVHFGADSAIKYLNQYLV